MPKEIITNWFHQNPSMGHGWPQINGTFFYSRLFFSGPPTTWITWKHPSNLRIVPLSSATMLEFQSLLRLHSPHLARIIDGGGAGSIGPHALRQANFGLEPWLHCLLSALCWGHSFHLSRSPFWGKNQMPINRGTDG